MEFNLPNLSLNALLAEPARLEASIGDLQRQFKESMATNFDYFVDTCQKASTISEVLDSAGKKAEELSADVGSAVEMCDALRLVAKETNDVTSVVSSAFRNLPQINAVMEVPRNISQCTAHHLYEEAFNFYTQLDSLAHQFPNIAILSSLLTDADAVRKETTWSLLKKFEEDLPLTDSIQTANLLRTCGLFTENELRLAFVTGKCSRLHAQVELLPRSDFGYFIRELTTLFRKSLFDLVKDYRVIFNEEAISDSMPLAIAINKEIDFYCAMLAKAIDAQPDIGRVKDTLQPAYFFGASLGKVGFDFCPLIDGVFLDSKWGAKRTE